MPRPTETHIYSYTHAEKLTSPAAREPQRVESALARKNIRLGPNLPAFITPKARRVSWVEWVLLLSSLVISSFKSLEVCSQVFSGLHELLVSLVVC